MSYIIEKTLIFANWYEKQSLKVQLQVDGRLNRIIDEDHFGHLKKLDKYTSELKFNNGNRIYYTIIESIVVILIVAGNKNTQDKDINKAKKIARHLHEQNKTKKTRS